MASDDDVLERLEKASTSKDDGGYVITLDVREVKEILAQLSALSDLRADRDNWIALLARCRDIATGASGIDDSEAIANPGLVPGHVERAFTASRDAIVEECAEVAKAIKIIDGAPTADDIAAIRRDPELACEAAGIITARRIAQAIRSLKADRAEGGE